MDHNNNNNHNQNTKLDTLSVSSNDSNHQRMFGNNKLTKTGTINKNSTRVNTKIKSKSSENLSTKSNANLSVSMGANNNAKSANRIGVFQRKSQPISNNRRTINHQNPMSKVTSKIDTGINSTNKNHHHPNSGSKNAEKMAPIMKFKEKFPNHNHKKTAKSIIDQFQDIEHILRRNSMTTYDDAPKTVPGVRTDGISPVKNFRNNNNNTPINNNNNNFHMDNGYELRLGS